MKKTLLILLSFVLLCSCGPHRLKCGPGKRCVNNTQNTQLAKVNS